MIAQRLSRVLLRARATELAEVRRNQVRLGAGYGDATTRELMTGEAGRAQSRFYIDARPGSRPTCAPQAA